jgi:hypothetical protein
MAYTITHPDGMKDAEFPTYARILTQQGIDLGHVPRVLEPTTGRRWLYVWPALEAAEKALRKLKKWTGNPDWQIEEVEAPAPAGPLGPLIIQLARQSDGFLFDLHPLTVTLLRSAFPSAIGPSRLFWDTERWNELQKGRQGNLQDLCWEVAMNLTQLSHDQVADIGFVVADAGSEEPIVSVSPAPRMVEGAA